MFTIQDEAAGLIPLILNPSKNDIVLDACSAPGGKTTYMAEIMQNQGKIDAWDIYEHRIKLVEQTAKRLGISIIKTSVNDATKMKQNYIEKYDKILLDVPCLGIGVLKRKPDIKWKRVQQDIQEINKMQRQILEICAKYLKKGGEMVYSTCSILKEENEDVINEFLTKNSEFELEKLQLEENNYFKKFIQNETFLRVYQNDKTDGFFIAKIRKN